MDELTFAVCTFQRVFDTYPAHDLLSLEELVHHLTRFELKPSVHRIIERDVSRAGLALSAWTAGDYRGGWHYSQLSKAAKAAKAAGEEEAAAVQARYDKLVKDARKRAKQELRIWAPTLYRKGVEKRGQDGVAQLSCLVLDYDDGKSIEAAKLIWEPWFHIGHTTWSHKPDKPKFRIVMPLANPVRAEDWPGVWLWAEAVAGEGIDPSCKGVSRAYALPVVPFKDWPREVWVNRQGALLDPVSEGLVRQAAPPPPSLDALLEQDHPSWFREPDADTPYIELASAPSAPRPTSEPITDTDWDIFGPSSGERQEPRPEVRSKPTPASAPTPTPTPTPAESRPPDIVLELLDRIVSRLERVERLVQKLAGIPEDQLGLTGQLERLQTLYEDGALSDDEFAKAKALLLDDEV